MIGVEGQYVFVISAGGIKDFLDEEGMEFFNLISQANGALPSFKLVFTTQRDDVLYYLSEGNDLQVSFGKEFKHMETIALQTFSKHIHPQGHGEWKVTLKGIMSRPGYLLNPKQRILTGSSVSVLQTVVSDYFTPDFNVTDTPDSMNWIQYNVPDKKFVMDTWLHAWAGENTFFAAAISADGRFIFRDVRKHMAAPVKWRFVRNIQKEGDLEMDGDPQIISNVGTINPWVGYGRNRNEFNFNTGIETELESEASVLMALSKNLTRRKDVEKKWFPPTFTNDNVHSNYQQAWMNNMMRLAVFSTHTIRVSYTNEMNDMRPLDKVIVLDSNKEQETSSIEHHSGLYLVDKIARSPQKRQFVTTVDLTKESFNALQGDFR